MHPGTFDEVRLHFEVEWLMTCINQPSFEKSLD
jgi:hypothetical protein